MEGSFHANTNSIRPVVSIQYRLVTDGRTDGRTHDDSTQRASKASRGKNRPIELVLVLLSRVMDWTAAGLPPECMTTVLVGVLRPRDDNDAGTEHADYTQYTIELIKQVSK